MQFSLAFMNRISNSPREKRRKAKERKKSKRGREKQNRDIMNVCSLQDFDYICEKEKKKEKKDREIEVKKRGE